MCDFRKLHFFFFWGGGGVIIALPILLSTLFHLEPQIVFKKGTHNGFNVMCMKNKINDLLIFAYRVDIFLLGFYSSGTVVVDSLFIVAHF